MKNTYGNILGNCGYDDEIQEFIPCKIEDARCGMLHCHRFDSRMNFEKTLDTEVVYSMIYHGSGIIPCHSVIFKGLFEDSYNPGLVADGE